MNCGKGTVVKSLGKPIFLTFYYEIHNMAILMVGIYEVRPTNIISNTVTIYAPVLQDPVKNRLRVKFLTNYSNPSFFFFVPFP
jgi:hypothetical protein